MMAARVGRGPCFRVSWFGFRVSGFAVVVEFCVSRFAFRGYFRVSRFAVEIQGFRIQGSVSDLRFWVSDFGVWGFGFQISVLDFGVRGPCFRVSRFAVWIQGSGFQVSVSGSSFRFSDLDFRDYGFGCRISRFVFRV
jgi:hypothetical protein